MKIQANDASVSRKQAASSQSLYQRQPGSIVFMDED